MFTCKNTEQRTEQHIKVHVVDFFTVSGSVQGADQCAQSDHDYNVQVLGRVVLNLLVVGGQATVNHPLNSYRRWTDGGTLVQMIDDSHDFKDSPIFWRSCQSISVYLLHLIIYTVAFIGPIPPDLVAFG